MRTVFLALVAANLLFFAWSRYFSTDETAADGVLLRRSEPEKLKIVPAAVPAAAPAVSATSRRLRLDSYGRSGNQSALLGRRAG